MKNIRNVFVALSVLMLLSITPVTVSAQNNQNYESNKGIYSITLTDEQSRDLAEKLFGSDVAANVIIKHTRTMYVEGDAVPDSITQWTLTPTLTQTGNAVGYWLVKSGIYGIQGSFNLRSCSGTDAKDGCWIGLDGGGLNDFIQVGFDMSNRKAFMQVWNSSGQLVLYNNDLFNGAKSVGDDIHLSIGWSSAGVYYVVCYDQTTNELWAEYENCNPGSGAMWILETPYKSGGGQYHIGTFGTVTFNTCNYWGDDLETTYPINYGSIGTLLKCYEYTLNNESLTPSDLGVGGNNFTITKN